MLMLNVRIMRFIICLGRASNTTKIAAHTRYTGSGYDRCEGSPFLSPLQAARTQSVIRPPDLFDLTLERWDQPRSDVCT